MPDALAGWLNEGLNTITVPYNSQPCGEANLMLGKCSACGGLML